MKKTTRLVAFVCMLCVYICLTAFAWGLYMSPDNTQQIWLPLTITFCMVAVACATVAAYLEW